MLVESVFTPSIVHIPRSATIRQAAVKMRDNHVGTLVVTEEGNPNRPVGIVTDRDLVIKGMADAATTWSCPVGDIMTAALATVLRTDPLQKALELMRSRGVRRLAVAEASDGSLAGILCFDDVVDAIALEACSLHGVVRNEISREIALTAQKVATDAGRT